jgi:unspecific monooxygenase
MIGTCILLLNAGHEATVHTLGNAVKALLEWETPSSALETATIADTVEEVLRFEPPLHIFTRFAYTDITIGGHPVSEGDEIALVLGAAGRDPKLVANPDRFDPWRADRSHAAFGAGLHFCLGAPLARLEMQIGLQHLFAAKPNIRITAPPRWARTYHFHGLEKLMVQA